MELKKDFEKLGEQMRGVIYAKSNEPARLGAFRILFIEVYKRRHGDLSPGSFDLALHGIMREDLRVLSSIGLDTVESYHVGIDYASLMEYPTPDRKGTVIVPLFIIAKSEPDDINKIKIKEAIEFAKTAIKYSQRNGKLGKVIQVEKVIQALDSIPEFTRIILTRAIPYVDEDQPCYIRKHQSIPVYYDIACSIIRLVFKDISEMYNKVKNENLTELDISHWISALISLAIPVIVDITSADRPPRQPVSIDVVYHTVKKLFEKVPITEPQKRELMRILKEMRGDSEYTGGRLRVTA